MDKLENYRNIVEKVINEYAAIPYAYGEIESRTSFDRDKDSYMLYSVGWNSRGRIHGINIHVDIINDKIYIQQDGTENGIVTDLELAGVPKSDIVLAFHAPELRKHTEYGVA
jgi:XisI protein